MSTTLFLGANFVSHDASVFGFCGKEVFAISEERFTRYKHDSIWPINALSALQRHFAMAEVRFDRIVCGIPMLNSKDTAVVDNYVYQQVQRKITGGRYLGEHLASLEEIKNGWGWIRQAISLWRQGEFGVSDVVSYLQARFVKRNLSHQVVRYVRAKLGDVPIDVHYYDHHECHAYSAFYMSQFSNAVVITMDGWGDGAFTKVFLADSNGIHLTQESRSISVDATHFKLPEQVRRSGIFSELSIGHAYSIITWLLGFVPGSDEGKVEALAALGTPDVILLDTFNSCVSLREEEIVIDRKRFLAVFHDPSSHAEILKMPREVIAASIQQFLEDVYLSLTRQVTQKYDVRQVCLAGGVAANVILNMRLFEVLGLEIFVVPAMADDGTAMGAAFMAALEFDPNINMAPLRTVAQGMPYYGTAYSAEETRSVLESALGLPIRWQWVGEAWQAECAERLCERQEIGAIFQGRCEFGPRALGNRSIVADLRNPENTKRINKLVKNRPGFQPFCPSFLDEEQARLFEHSYLNKHMTCAFRMREEYVSELPCAVHADHTARLQFVTSDSNPEFYALLQEVKRRTGFGGLLNTSFNKHGRTICESPADALTDFIDCGIDFMMINGYLVTRT